MFINLIENSIAYTDAPGFIDIKLSSLNDKVVVFVQDSPPGVTKDECELLFEPLYRQDASRNRRTAGAGLGLAICKNIVEAHQGSISANPSELGGLAIVISLPVFQG